MSLSNTTGSATNLVPPIYVSTPLMFFPERLAYQISVATYTHIGCLAVVLWDAIDNIKLDYKLLFKHKVGPATGIYFTARISVLIYMLSRAVLLTIPISDCTRMYNIINGFLIVFSYATKALFALRVCAVYGMQRSAIAVYGGLWLVVAGMITTFPITFTAAHVAGTQYCGEVLKGNLLGPTWIIFTVNNVLVYAGVAYRVTKMFPEHKGSDSKDSWISLPIVFRPTRLPTVSRALLQGSQLYFLVALLTSTIVTVCVYAFPQDPPIRVMFIVCYITLIHILSSRVYRNIKLGLMSDSTLTDGALGAMVFQDPGVKEGPYMRDEGLTSRPVTTRNVGGSAVLDGNSPPTAVTQEQGMV